jgi:Fe-S-cluster-containing hydrogenase component 2
MAETKLNIKKDLCLGCGLCVKNCPNQAISLIKNKAEIKQQECNQCRNCLLLCPRGAITEIDAVSTEEIQTLVNELKRETEMVISRIEQLERQSRK